MRSLLLLTLPAIVSAFEDATGLLQLQRSSVSAASAAAADCFKTGNCGFSTVERKEQIMDKVEKIKGKIEEKTKKVEVIKEVEKMKGKIDEKVANLKVIKEKTAQQMDKIDKVDSIDKVEMVKDIAKKMGKVKSVKKIADKVVVKKKKLSRKEAHMAMMRNVMGRHQANKNKKKKKSRGKVSPKTKTE